MLSKLTLWLIAGYQKTLSPDHGPLKDLHPHGFCPHSPTCSDYAKNQIQQSGLILALPRILWRLLHCTPFSTGKRKAESG